LQAKLFNPAVQKIIWDICSEFASRFIWLFDYPWLNDGTIWCQGDINCVYHSEGQMHKRAKWSNSRIYIHVQIFLSMEFKLLQKLITFISICLFINSFTNNYEFMYVIDVYWKRVCIKIKKHNNALILI